MAVSSKLWNQCNCYEIGHCWTPSCLEASTDIAKASVLYSFKVYMAFYLISHTYKLMRDHRPFSEAISPKKFLFDVIQSTSFLSSNVPMIVSSFCLYRQLVGGFYPWFGFFSTLPACAVAISIERKGRRSLLALYMMNLALEVLFNMFVQRGYVSPIRYGEVLLFAVSNAALFFMYRLGNTLSKDAKSAMKLMIGPSEMPRSEQEELKQVTEETSRHAPSGSPDTPSFVKFLPKTLQTVILQLINRLRAFKKHSLCLHDYSCAYYTVASFLRKFSIGYAIQGVINVLKSIRTPSGIPSAVFHRSNVILGLFLGLYSGLTRFVSCALRWIRNKDSPVHGLLAGFIAGLSSIFYRSKTISLYLASKVGENLFYKLQDLKYLPEIPHGDILLYSISTSLVIQAAVFEPHNIRPAYWRFLLGLTGNHFAQMNRKLLDGYGTLASKMYPDYWPNYVKSFTPNLVGAGLL